jgi:TPR repeat protein
LKKTIFKTLLNTIFLLIGLISSSLTLADFEAGEQAYQKGDRDTAFKEYYAAAHDKDARAYSKLAGMYLYGLGTEKNYHQAYIWFHMASLTSDIYAGRFRDAATSMMTREEYEQAVKAAEQMRTTLQISPAAAKTRSSVNPQSTSQ